MQAAFSFMATFIETFDHRFADVHQRSLRILEICGDANLFRRPRELPHTFAMFSVGEYILRSAASVEQAFGGITTRLWDDPFEWTLPEKLGTAQLVAGYLEEVEVTRQKGFGFFSADADLQKQMPAPAAMKSIFEILVDTLGRAEHYQGRATAIAQYFTDEKLPRL